MSALQRTYYLSRIAGRRHAYRYRRRQGPKLGSKFFIVLIIRKTRRRYAKRPSNPSEAWTVDLKLFQKGSGDRGSILPVTSRPCVRGIKSKQYCLSSAQEQHFFVAKSKEYGVYCRHQRRQFWWGGKTLDCRRRWCGLCRWRKYWQGSRPLRMH